MLLHVNYRREQCIACKLEMLYMRRNLEGVGTNPREGNPAPWKKYVECS